MLAVELGRIREEPVSEEELERAKDNVKGRDRAGARVDLGADGPPRLGGLLAEMPILELDETIERIEAVDAQQVGALAAELLAVERLCAAAIGPDEEAFRAALDAAAAGARGGSA